MPLRLLRLLVLIASLACDVALCATSKGTLTTTTRKTTTRSFTLNLALKTLAPDGVPKQMMLANGQLDYTIEVNTGDVLHVTVNNRMNVPTSIHWHGIFQTDSPWMDGPGQITQCPIKANSTFTYKFNTKGQAGTFWWHAHYASHYVNGIRGPLIIRDPKDPYKSQYDEEAVITLSDHFHVSAKTVLDQYYAALDPAPDSGLINGKGRYDCKYASRETKCKANSPIQVFNVKPMRRYRLRIINMSAQAMFRVSLDGHKMTVIEADGVNTNPTVVTSFTISSSQRYSVIVEAKQPISNYWFRATILDMYTPTGYIITNGLNFNCRAIWRYEGAKTQSTPTTKPINDVAPLNVYTLGELHGMTQSQLPDSDDTDRVYFKFNVAADARNKTVSQITLNSNSTNIYSSRFTLPKAPLLRTLLNSTAKLPASSNTYETKPGYTLLKVSNYDNIDHTFHLHGHTFHVVSSGFQLSSAVTGQTYPRRDAIQVPPCEGRAVTNSTNPENGCTPGYVTLLIEFNHPGVWLFHCHIEWHMATGLVMTFVNRRGIEMVKNNIPNGFWDHCTSK
ncbi:Cupredoxin [Chytriomyces sp. MP71]|nr:Cupredoxin [Chytriomyces sp. MP71]